tara:strand:+ start:1023 stop:1991 length:969 start_codon:yes stop_codon:yes gene_type:complete
MDTSKKHLYFNPTTDSVAAAVSVPVSGFLGMEVTSTGNLIMYFREGHDSDTLDITLTRSTTGDDPKLVMEEIVNAINFSKESTVVVADNFTGEYLTPKIQEISLLKDGFVAPILFQRPTTFLVSEGDEGIPEAAGDGFKIASYTFETGSIGQINGEVITTLFIELNTLTCPGTANQAIGIGSSSSPAFITQITTAKNGIVYRGEIICVEATGGSGTTGQISIVANSVGTIDPGEDTTAGTSDVIMNMTDEFTIAEVRNFDSSTLDVAGSNNPQGGIGAGGIQGYYLYLAPNSSTQAGGTYGSGKFIIRLFGAPTENLNDISV